LPPRFAAWFAARGWRPHPHQLAMVDQARQGRSALLIAPTGGGKTLAGFLPSLIALAERPAECLHTLYISPLKALAVDIQRNLEQPIAEMGSPSAPRHAPATRRTPSANASARSRRSC
jgi:ATP-dependent Lhr-like helicase